MKKRKIQIYFQKYYYEYLVAMPAYWFSVTTIQDLNSKIEKTAKKLANNGEYRVHPLTENLWMEYQKGNIEGAKL